MAPDYLKNQLLVMIYQNMDKYDADVTIELLEDYVNNKFLDKCDISIRAATNLKLCGFECLYDFKGLTLEKLLERGLHKKTIEEIVEYHKLITL